MRLITVFVACALMTGCGGPTVGPEEALRQWIGEAEAAAERLDRRGLLAMVSENYADARGNDREAIDKLLRLYFLRQKSVELVMKVEDLTVIGESAAEILVTAAGVGTTTRAFGINADGYRFALELEKDDGRWMLIGARWGQLGQALH